MRSFLRRCVISCVTAGVLASLQWTVRAADVNMYGVVKAQRFDQENPVVPALRSGDSMMGDFPMRFEVFVDANGPSLISNGSVQIPGGSSTNLSASSPGSSHLQFRDGFESKLELDAKYIPGSYVVHFVTANNGTKDITLTLGTESYPDVPFISNFTALQTAIAGADITINFTSAASGVGADFVMLEVEDETGNTIYNNSSLNSSSTSATIPANTLSAGMRYKGKLMFAKGAFDTTSYSGATGVTAYSKETRFSIVTTGGTDNTAPNFSFSIPMFGENGVPVNSLIAFYFNEPMDTSFPVSIGWTNVTGANFTYTWSADKTVLFCKYSTSLPLSTQVGWSLNQSGFRDAALNTLQSTVGGYFNTSSQSASTLDVDSVFLGKGKTGIQTNSSSAIADGGYQANVMANFTGRNTVTNGTLSWTLGSVTLTPDDFNGEQIQGDMNYASQTDLDRFFPDNTTYTVTLNTAHDGTKTLNNVVVSSDAFPALPHVSNYDAAQIVNPTNAFILTWDAFVGGTANDTIMVEIESETGNTIFDTGFGVINGTATQYSLPDHTFAPGRTYRATLRFLKNSAVDTTANYNGVMAGTAHYSQTTFTIKTTGTVIAPRLEAGAFVSGQFQLRLKGETNQQYTVEVSEDLVNWTSSMTGYTTNSVGTNAFMASFDFNDSSAQFSFHRFYRAREGYMGNSSGNNVSLEGTVRSASNHNVLIAGAVVGTLLDGQTTTTDSFGHFFLQTQTPANYSSTPYTVTVSANGYQTFQQAAVWGDHPTGLFIDLNSNP